jgi:dihydroxyacetone kinase-like protein
MSDSALGRTELVVRTIAQTAVDNETYFCELDAVVGDGDFGYSLARGFEIVLSDWDELEYENPGGLLKKTALILTKRIGGTSGPIWGTAFLRAGASLGDNAEPSGEEAIAALRAAIEGVKQRGQTDLGDKTLLDALVPFADTLEAELGDERPLADAWAAAAQAADASARRTAELAARVGRARPLGERSVGTPDPGAVSMALCVGAASAVLREAAGA